jgi:hypothetical protein
MLYMYCATLDLRLNNHLAEFEINFLFRYTAIEVRHQRVIVKFCVDSIRSAKVMVA